MLKTDSNAKKLANLVCQLHT